MACIYPLLGYLTDKFRCRTVAAGGVLINNNPYRTIVALIRGPEKGAEPWLIHLLQKS